MNAFWSQSLLIGIATVAVGCAGPEANMSFEERLLADGYPSEYVDGFKARYESFCPETRTLPDQNGSLVRLLLAYCKGKNMEAKVGQEARRSKSYQQGLADGRAEALIGSFRIDSVSEYQHGQFVAWQESYYMWKAQDQMIRNLQFEKLKR